MPQEFEVTLAATPHTLGKLRRAPALQSIARARPRTQRIETSYWDTPALDLRQAGFALRMRKTRKGWLQSIKAYTNEPFLRHEVEAEIANAQPDLALAKRAARKMSRRWPAAAVEVAPVFTTRISRTTWNVTFADGTEAEIAADRGALELPGPPSKSLPICEIELELKKGRVEPVYELAYRLAHELPDTRLAFRSKADRGYALASGVVPPPRHARTWTIDPSWKAEQVIARAAADCLSQVQDNLDGVRTDADPQYLHQMRIGVRRVRTLFRLCSAARLAEAPPRLRNDLKWLWQLLGDSRDWDVFAQSTWPPIAQAAHGDRHAIEAFGAAIARERALSRDALRRTLDSTRLQKLLLALGWFFAHTTASPSSDARRSVAKLARRVLDRQHARVCRDGTQLKQASETQRHQLRIDAKKLRYQAEFFESLYDRRATRAYLRRLAGLQDVLGNLNDVAMTQVIAHRAMARLPRARASVVQGLLDGYVVASNGRLLASLDAAWKAFVKAKPLWSAKPA